MKRTTTLSLTACLTVLAACAAQDAVVQRELVLERIAGLHLGRARLSGDYDDYAKAEAALERAFTVAGKDAGPHLTRIALNFTLHRLDRVAADLERVEKYAIKTPAERRALRELGAELAFQQGRYADARAGFEAALAAEPEALLRWKTGDFAGTEDLYGQALGKRVEGEPAAWLHLQLGLMDLERGRHDEALAHYRDAAARLSGYWLLDEHIAEILALQGQTDAALALYADIIARTDNPEFMDAVAGIHRAAGRTEAAAPLIARADAIYEAQLLRFPEAAYGHALEHFLEFGADPKRAVTLAEANTPGALPVTVTHHRTRPNAEAKISLARAYLQAGRKDDARKAIDEALATPWNTADLHAVAAEVLTATGDAAAASEQRRLALAIKGADYVHQLADYVDAHLKLLSGGRRITNSTGLQRAALLVAMQLADELFREKDLHQRFRRKVGDKLEVLRRALDEHEQRLAAMQDPPRDVPGPPPPL